MKLTAENRQIQQWKASLFGLGLISLVTIVVWIAVSIAANLTKTKADPEMTKIIKPINPNLDVNLIRDFTSNRIVLPEKFIVSAIIRDGKDVNTTTIDPFSDNPNQPPVTNDTQHENTEENSD